MKQTARKFLSLLLSLALLCGLCVPTAFATESRYSDTQDHWAEEAIDRWSEYGVVQGNNGQFLPNGDLTRGQMATVLSNTLGLTETAENPFADVPDDAWYAPYVLRCYAAGIMLGDGKNAHPEAVITRQEAMTMLCRAFSIEPDENADLSAFADGGNTEDWAVPFVAALVNSGIVGGIGDGLLAPSGTMTRASMVTVIDRAVVQYITAPGEYELTDADGLILVVAGDVTLTGKTTANILVTPAADGKAVTFSEATVTGSITIQADEATITNKGSELPEITLTGEGSEVSEVEEPKTPSVSGGGGSSRPSTPSYSSLTIDEGKTVSDGTYQNVTITAAVGEGEVTLTGVTVRGDLTIQGGGSVKLVNCTVTGSVVMAKESGEKPTLHLTNTPVSNVEVQNVASIEAADTASVVTAVEATANVYVLGQDTSIVTLTVPNTAESPVTVDVTAGAVATVQAKGETAVTGAAGSVGSVVAEAPVTVSAETVGIVEIPATAPAAVAVAVTGLGSVEVAVNSTNGAAITTGGSATVEVSTELDTTPGGVTVNGTEQTHAHKWNSGEVTTAPTCEGEGVKTYTCAADGCTDPAATKTEAVSALGHSYGEWVKADDTNHTRTCANDSTHTETAAHGWDDGVQTTAPTCERDGVKTYTCSGCSGTKTEAITATGHSYGEWTKADADNHIRTCANDSTHTETAAHTAVTDAAVAATCIATGLTEGSHCSVCNGIIVEQTTVTALGHDFTGDYTYDAAGHWHVCARDNCEETDTKAAHTYNTTDCTQAATCACGYEKAAGEHVWDDGVQTTAPTCEGDGVKTYTCSSCSTTKTEAITATGHSYGDWVKADDTNHIRTCANDSSHTETAAHSWGDGVVTTAPTETTEGVRTFTCADCSATKTEAEPVKAAVNVWFTRTGSSPYLHWTAVELGTNERYYVNGISATSPQMKADLLLTDATENVTITITKGTYSGTKETLYTLENAIVVESQDTVALTLTGISEGDDWGKYQLAPTDTSVDTTGAVYYLSVKDPNGAEIMSRTSSTTGLFSVAPWAGCTAEGHLAFFTLGESVVEDGVTKYMSLTYQATPSVTIDTITLGTASTEVTEVSTLNELSAALNKGGTVKLTTDITSTSILNAESGPAATLDLNGCNLTLSTLNVNKGKELTILDNGEDGSITVTNNSQIRHGTILRMNGVVNNGKLDSGGNTTPRLVSLVGVTINHTGTASAVQLEGGDSVVVENSTITGAETAYNALLIKNAKDVSISGGTYTCNSTDSSGASIALQNCETVKISGVTGTSSQRGLNLNQCGTVTVTDSSFTSGINSTSSIAYVVYARDVDSLTLNGGTYTGNATNSDVIYLYASDSSAYNTYILGGTYTHNADGNQIIKKSGDSVTVTVTGGTFIGFDPTEYVDTTTHTVTSDENGTWTVAPISSGS